MFVNYLHIKNCVHIYDKQNTLFFNLQVHNIVHIFLSFPVFEFVIINYPKLNVNEVFFNHGIS